MLRPPSGGHNRPSPAIALSTPQAVLDDAVAAARQGQPTDGFAWIRQGWAAAQHRSCLYVFGGMVVKEVGGRWRVGQSVGRSAAWRAAMAERQAGTRAGKRQAGGRTD